MEVMVHLDCGFGVWGLGGFGLSVLLVDKYRLSAGKLGNMARYGTFLIMDSETLCPLEVV